LTYSVVVVFLFFLVTNNNLVFINFETGKYMYFTIYNVRKSVVIHFSYSILFVANNQQIHKIELFAKIDVSIIYY